MGLVTKFKDAHRPPDEADIEKALWNTGYQWSETSSELLMQQYITCLEMADKISERRSTTNVFFLTLNTVALTAVAALSDKVVSKPGNLLWIALIALFTSCVAWGFLLRSYRTLNTAKFKVIGMMEKRLPASPFWGAEWQALKEGEDWVVHIPLSPIETIVPIVFAVLYIALGVALGFSL